MRWEYIFTNNNVFFYLRRKNCTQKFMQDIVLLFIYCFLQLNIAVYQHDTITSSNTQPLCQSSQQLKPTQIYFRCNRINVSPGIAQRSPKNVHLNKTLNNTTQTRVMKHTRCIPSMLHFLWHPLKWLAITPEVTATCIYCNITPQNKPSMDSIWRY